MFRFKTLAILCLLIAFSQSASAARLVPYQDKLSSNLQKTFVELETACVRSDDNRFELAQQLLQTANSSSASVKTWATIVYVHVLLENDSIQRARSILDDSVAVNWSSLEPWLSSYHQYTQGILSLYGGKYAVASVFFNDALQKNAETPVLESLILQSQADNLRYRGHTERSLNKWFESLELAEQMGDSMAISDALFGRGIVRFIRDELDFAESDINASLRYYASVFAHKSVANCQSLFGLIDYQRGSYQSSINHSLKAFEIRETIKDIKGQGESLNNLALGYMGLKNWNQALRYLEQAVQLKTIANDYTQMTVIFNNIGQCYKKLGDGEMALNFFKKAEEKGTENGQMGDVVNSYRNIANYYKEIEDFEHAFAYQNKLIDLKDSLAETERLEAIGELEVLHNTKQKEQEIQMLKQSQTIITNRWLTLAMILFLIIVIAILFADNQKRKHRQQRELLEKEDDLKRAELKIMSDLLEYNRKKLSLYTDNLLKKNELVGQLEAKLNENLDGSEKGKEIRNDFSNLRILTDEHWDEFKELFNGVHRGLLSRLIEKHENLTLAEQRLFLLMKLDLSTKEIANILGVSPDSIKKGRYRLKKKLHVDEEKTLQEFISAF